MRKEFKITDEQFEKLLEASQPVRLITLQIGMPTPPQENANIAWKALGEELGFEYKTVEPVADKDDHYFTAEVIRESLICPKCDFGFFVDWQEAGKEDTPTMETCPDCYTSLLDGEAI